MSFDPNKTYWQSFKITVGVVLRSSPIKRHEFELAMEAACDLAGVFGAVALRLALIATFPISIPVITWLVQKDRALTTKRMKEAQKRVLDHQNRLTRPTQ